MSYIILTPTKVKGAIDLYKMSDIGYSRLKHKCSDRPLLDESRLYGGQAIADMKLPFIFWLFNEVGKL